jgi:hypothetical protein
MTGANSGVGIAYPFGDLSSPPVFVGFALQDL